MKLMKAVVMLAVFATGAASAQVEDPSLAEAKARISMQMKDPDSARFIGLVMQKEHGKGTVCGWINAKNSYGGYTGFKPFFVMGDHAVVRDGPDSLFTAVWNTCLPPDGEKFGDVLVGLPNLKIEKECAQRCKRSPDKPELYAKCEVNEAAAKTWLQGHPTSSLAAMLCEREIRTYQSYSMGQSCVVNQEADIVFRRGPPAAPALAEQATRN